MTVLAAAGSVPLIDSGSSVRRLSRPRAASEDPRFVGRRAEQRHWPADLTGPGAGIVIWGVGGIGKTKLADKVADRVQAATPGLILVRPTGPLTLDSLISAVTGSIRGGLVNGEPEETTRALDDAARTDRSWQDRLAALRNRVFGRLPLVVRIDDFEENLRSSGDTGREVSDRVLGEFLAAWAADPGRSRLLITSRHQFTLPGGAERHLSFRPLGALSRTETTKLAWSLPALDRKSEDDLTTVWRLVGGHPLSLEYLDALLSGGRARYADVTEKLSEAITSRLDGTDRASWLTARTRLDTALAETVALAADNVLLPGLLTRIDEVAGSGNLLVGVSVYRERVDRNAVLFQAGEPDPEAEHVPDFVALHDRLRGILAAAGIHARQLPDPASLPERVRAELAPHLEAAYRPPRPPFRAPAALDGQIGACRAAGLLIVNEGDDGTERFFVHRWTAANLAAPPAGAALRRAHEQAAAYWRWRAAAQRQSAEARVHDDLEARYHLLEAGRPEEAADAALGAARLLEEQGSWEEEDWLATDVLDSLPAASSRRGQWIHRRGNAALLRGDYREARQQYQLALGTYADDDLAGKAASHGTLGTVAQHLNEREEAERQFELSANFSKRISDERHSMAATHNQRGVLAQSNGDHAEAGRQYERALELGKELEDERLIAAAYGNLGNLAYLSKDYKKAERQYERALKLAKESGDQDGIANGHHQLGMIAEAQKRNQEARQQYQLALDIREKSGDQAGIANGYGRLGMIALKQRHYDEARYRFEGCENICRRIGDQAGGSEQLRWPWPDRPGARAARRGHIPAPA